MRRRRSFAVAFPVDPRSTVQPGSLRTTPATRRPALCGARESQPGRGRRQWLPLCGLLALLLLAKPVSAQDPAADECPEGHIDHIFVDPNSIFDVDNLPEDRRIRWAYDAANALHMRTREPLVLRELPIERGDCPGPEDFREAARILRELRFIARADVYAVPQADGSRHLVVDTRDEWSTRFTFAIEGDGGVRLRGGSIVEENFLGRGTLVGAYYDAREEIRDVGGMLEVPRLFGTRMDGRLTVARTRGGREVEQELMVPFVGETPAMAARQSVRARDDLFMYAVDDDGMRFSHLLLPLRVERWEVAGARRFGEPGGLTLLGLGISREETVPRLDAESVEGIHDRAFDDPWPVDEEHLDLLADQGEPRGATRLNFLLGRRHVEFVERQGLDPVRGVQDVPVGREATLSVGPSLGFLSPSGMQAPKDVFGRMRLFSGWTDGPWILQAHGVAEGRRVRSGGVAGPGWRDVFAESELTVYRRSGDEARHTLMARLTASGGWSVTTPYQLTLGGRDGVRGLRDDAVPSGHRLVGTVEERIRLPQGPFSDLADFGLTIFADVGRSWAGEVPFGRSSSWQGSLGGGIRIGFPAGTASVIRVDLAQPLGSEAGGLRLRISSRDFPGIMTEPGSLQLDRSRRAGVGTNFVGVGR